MHGLVVANGLTVYNPTQVPLLQQSKVYQRVLQGLLGHGRHHQRPYGAILPHLSESIQHTFLTISTSRTRPLCIEFTWLPHLHHPSYNKSTFVALVWTPKPDCVDREQHNNMKELVPQMAVAYVITELLPFSIAFWLSKKTESPSTFDAGDDDDDSDTVFLVAAMTSVVLILSSLFWYAYLHDQTPNEEIEEQEQELIVTTTSSLSERTSSYKVSFNPNHLRERYELVTLVFIGEVCFAAAHFHIPGGTQGDNKTILPAVVSAATALLAAFAAYLLIFVTQPAEQTEFWIRSVKHRVGGIILFVGLFCAIPGIGAGVVRVMTMEDMHDGRNAMEASSSEQHHSNSCSPHTSGLLCYASVSFLILSALMNLCHQEGDCLVKMGIWARSTVRFFCGVGCLLLSVIPSFAATNGVLSCIGTIPSPTFYCPLLMLTSAAVEVWAVGSMHWLS